MNQLLDEMLVDAIIPALNESKTVGNVVSALYSSIHISSVIVVDNGSVDDTASVAADAGACVVRCAQRGLGRAVKAGLDRATSAYVLKTDADIESWNPAWVEQLLPSSDRSLMRLTFDSPYDSFPVTRLVAEPLLRMWLRGDPPRRSLTGTYCFKRNLFDPMILADNWAFDVSLLCSAFASDIEIENIDVGILKDRERPLDHYVPMAYDIIEYFVDRFRER